MRSGGHLPGLDRGNRFLKRLSGVLEADGAAGDVGWEPLDVFNLRQLQVERSIACELHQEVMDGLEDEAARPAKRVLDGSQAADNPKTLEREACLFPDLAERRNLRGLPLLDVPLGETPATAGLDQRKLRTACRLPEDHAAGRNLAAGATGRTLLWHSTIMLLAMTRDGQRLMVVMPHPDDECFGCASTIARYSAEGASVSLVTMTRGGGGLWNGREAGDLRRLGDVRELELRDAAAELGVRFVEVFDYPDGALEKVEEVDDVRNRFVGDIVRCLRVHRPQVVVCFGPEGTYGHPDHKVMSRLTVQACTMAGDASAYELEAVALGISPWSPSKLYFQTATTMIVDSLKLPPQPPITTRISIAGFQEAKLRAFAHHRTQTQEWEPLRKFVEGQGKVEVFSLVGAPAGLIEDDLFHGIGAAEAAAQRASIARPSGSS